MANQTQNPFSEDKPQLVHFEKDESHYEFCRMQMHEIERIHRRTFICNLALCIVVCFLAIFRVYVGGFSILSKAYTDIDAPGAILAGGIFQIVFGMFIIILGYLAWANFHTLNIVLEAWYAIIALTGIFKLDYITAIIGAVGAVFYFFSIREMQHEARLSEMEGYPDFQEKFDLSKSDVVIQTLLAHQGEHRTKSTLFTTDYSLRKKKKTAFEPAEPEKPETDAGKALAEELQKRLADVQEERKAAEQAETASAEPETPEAPVNEERPEEPVPAAEEQPAPEEEPSAQEKADAILAEAEAKAKAILAEAEAKAKAMQNTDAKPKEKPAQNQKAKPKKKSPAQHQGHPNNRKKK